MQTALPSSAGLQGPLCRAMAQGFCCWVAVGVMAREMLRGTLFCVLHVIVPATVPACQGTAGLWKLRAQRRGWDKDRGGTGPLGVRGAGGTG